MLQLAVIAPNSTEFFAECVQTSFQVWCPKACMKHSGCGRKRCSVEGIERVNTKPKYRDGRKFRRERERGRITKKANSKCPQDHESTTRNDPQEETDCRDNRVHKKRSTIVSISDINQVLINDKSTTVKKKKMLLPAENTKTTTHRGRPQIYIDRFAEGRPRITGLHKLHSM